MTQKTKVFQRRHEPIPLDEAEVRAMVDSLTEQVATEPALANVVTRAVLARAIERAEPPPVKQPIFGLLVMEDGALVVIRDVNMASRRCRADLFSPEGRFLGAFETADWTLAAPDNGGFVTRLVFKNSRAYAVATDEWGDNRVVRYKIVRR